jgi:uncharacterized protein (DUF1501 family)
VPDFLSRAAVAASPQPSDRDTVLVALQLSGGNDGLNTLVPYEDDHYGRSRRTLRLTANQVHKIGSDLGFHPRMQGFARLFREGRLSVVQGVGYPKSDRDHDGAMRNWHTARPEQAECQTGWLGRAIDQFCVSHEASVPGVFVGPIARPFGLNAQRAVVPSIRSAQQWTLRTTPDGSSGEAHRQRLEAISQHPRADGENRLLDFARRRTLSAYADSRDIENVFRNASLTAEYPPFLLAAQLKTVAQLIRADVGIRIYFAELGGGGIGGFDNHANQRDNHAAVLHQLSESVAAFVDDLARDCLLDRVLLMTFSEFGRTLAENGRRGTDHGAAAPMFLAGGKLRGEMVGPHPDLADLDGGAPKFHTDFRRVYATATRNWLGLDGQAVVGGEFEPLDLFEV